MTATKKGAPEDLRVVEPPVEMPVPGQLRVRGRAAGVGSTDFMVPPGYEIAGVVDAIGTGVVGFKVGDPRGK